MGLTTEERLRNYRIAHESVARDNERLQDEIARLLAENQQYRDTLVISKEIQRLRAALEHAYDDAKEAAINPFLADELGENDGPWELQKKIGVAIDFRKKLALADAEGK